VPSVVFGAAARAELIEARDWYSARDAEMAARLLRKSRGSSTGLLRRHSISLLSTETSAALGGDDPYALFFRVVDETVHVIACFHSRRDPRQWQRRS
jgi:toxin ParE1/3/4